MILHGLAESRAVLDAMPIGLVIYDEDRRLVYANAAYHEAVGLPPGTFRRGSEMADNVRMLAYRGVYGPGDPEQQTIQMLTQNMSEPRRVRGRHPDGRSFEAFFSPLGDGAHMVCTTNTTALVAMREEAETVVSRIHQAISSLRIGLAVFGPDRRLGLHNRRFTELLGLASPSLPPGTPFVDVLQIMQVRDEYAGFEGDLFIASQMSFDRSRPANFRRQRTNGQVIDIQSDPLPDGGWTMTVSDISALARAEDEARRRAGMLDGVVRHMPHGIAVYGPDRRVAMLNAAYGQVMQGAPIAVGDTLEEVIRRRAEAGEYGPGEPEEITRQQLQLADPARPSVRRRTRPSGETIDVRTAPLPDGGYMSVVTDVTPLVAAETESGRQAEAMAAMLANIRHGIVLWDRSHRIVAANPVATQLLGAPPDLLTPGRTLEEVIDAALTRGNLGDGSVGRMSAERLRARDRSLSHEEQRYTSSGRVLEVRSDPTPDGGFVTTYTDVTTIREAEEALRLAKTAAEAANAAKSRFLAAMSHELRLPLNTVIAQSGAISRAATDKLDRMGRNAPAPGSMDPAPILEAAEEIHIASRRLLGTIDSILDVARLEAGRFELSDDLVDLSSLIRACVRAADASAAAAEVTLTAQLVDPLPAVRGDERRLRQALNHIVANAVKFTPAQGRVELSVLYDPSNGELQLNVADTGLGIAEGSIEQVFEPFAQAGATVGQDGGRFTGSGLGLYISRALMRAHGGDLTLQSKVGQGTIAIMHIPARRVIPAGVLF